VSRFDDDGYAIIERVVDETRGDAILARLPAGRAGSRNLLDESWCRQLAAEVRAHRDVRVLLPEHVRAVQCTLFDKSPRRNWYSGWSTKEGVLYVQPPPAVLESLVAARIHLDASTADNGPLRIVPGSHRLGRLEPGQADEARRREGEVVCLVPRGGALVMRPLLVHASSKVSAPVSRRVLHFVFGPPGLPHGLAWHQAV
jgi:ectoine hydroxylase-related dioxygenase (phytanoyl-CoA dioxygenase family)